MCLVLSPSWCYIGRVTRVTNTELFLNVVLSDIDTRSCVVDVLRLPTPNTTAGCTHTIYHSTHTHGHVPAHAPYHTYTPAVAATWNSHAHRSVLHATPRACMRREYATACRWSGIAVEPMRFNFRSLCANYARWPSVLPLRIAVSDVARDEASMTRGRGTVAVWSRCGVTRGGVLVGLCGLARRVLLRCVESVRTACGVRVESSWGAIRCECPTAWDIQQPEQCQGRGSCQTRGVAKV